MDCNQDYYHSQYRLRPDYDENMDTMKDRNNYDQYICSVQYMKTTCSEHIVYINCFECQNKNKKQFMYITCSEHVVFMYWTGKSMNNLLSYCGLVDARTSAAKKDLHLHFKSSSVYFLNKNPFTCSKGSNRNCLEVVQRLSSN